MESAVVVEEMDTIPYVDEETELIEDIKKRFCQTKIIGPHSLDVRIKDCLIHPQYFGLWSQNGNNPINYFGLSVFDGTVKDNIESYNKTHNLFKGLSIDEHGIAFIIGDSPLYGTERLPGNFTKEYLDMFKFKDHSALVTYEFAIDEDLEFLVGKYHVHDSDHAGHAVMEPLSESRESLLVEERFKSMYDRVIQNVKKYRMDKESARLQNQMIEEAKRNDDMHEPLCGPSETRVFGSAKAGDVLSIGEGTGTSRKIMN